MYMVITASSIFRSHYGPGFEPCAGVLLRRWRHSARTGLFAVLATIAVLLLIALLAVVLARPALAGDTLAGPIPATVVRVVDGDTLEVRARIWLGQEIETVVRLLGVVAPELRGDCARERALAEQARDYLVARIDGAPVRLIEIAYGKYAGRVVADVTTPEGVGLAGLLIAAGLARAYDGGRRAGWCDDPLTLGPPETALANP